MGACVCVWQEYCDRGNLDRAVTAGIFRRINGWPDLVSPSDHLMSGLEGLIHYYCVNCGSAGLVRCGRSCPGHRQRSASLPILPAFVLFTLLDGRSSFPRPLVHASLHVGHLSKARASVHSSRRVSQSD